MSDFIHDGGVSGKAEKHRKSASSAWESALILLNGFLLPLFVEKKRIWNFFMRIFEGFPLNGGTRVNPFFLWLRLRAKTFKLILQNETGIFWRFSSEVSTKKN